MTRTMSDADRQFIAVLTAIAERAQAEDTAERAEENRRSEWHRAYAEYCPAGPTRCRHDDVPGLTSYCTPDTLPGLWWLASKTSTRSFHHDTIECPHRL